MAEQNWTKEDINNTMAFCGATLDPFSWIKWKLPVNEVINNLLKIEKPVSKQTCNSLFDEYGYDEEGFDIDGLNANGCDRTGYDKNGWDEEGFDKGGFDEWGYDKNGYDENGYDVDGNC